MPCISFCYIVFTVSFMLMFIYYYCYCYLICLLFLLDVECCLRLHSTLDRIALTILDLHVQVLKTGARKLIQPKRTYATLKNCLGAYRSLSVQPAFRLQFSGPPFVTRENRVFCIFCLLLVDVIFCPVILYHMS